METLGKVAMYLLDDSPLALSIGTEIENKKLSFIWQYGCLPYLAPAKAVRVYCARGKRWTAKRIQSRVPVFELHTKLNGVSCVDSVNNSAIGAAATLALEPEPTEVARQTKVAENKINKKGNNHLCRCRTIERTETAILIMALRCRLQNNTHTSGNQERDPRPSWCEHACKSCAPRSRPRARQS